jgi:hypothetical protein
MKATILAPTHGFWVESSEDELYEIIVKNRIEIEGWQLREALSVDSELDHDGGENRKIGFFLTLEGKIEFGLSEHLANKLGRAAWEIEPFEFHYFEHLWRHHQGLLRDPNIQKIMTFETVFIPTRIDGRRFYGYEEFARLGSGTDSSPGELSDDDLAWEILRRMDSVMANEANWYNDFELEWYERRENFISIEPKFFPTSKVTLSELRARWMRAKNLISEFSTLDWSAENDLQTRKALENLDLDTVLEVCFLDYHGEGLRRLTKIAGDVFLQRLPNTEYLLG